MIEKPQTSTQEIAITVLQPLGRDMAGSATIILDAEQIEESPSSS
jgi:hypothetical protein